MEKEKPKRNWLGLVVEIVKVVIAFLAGTGVSNL